jgi:hypothetical protein
VVGFLVLGTLAIVLFKRHRGVLAFLCGALAALCPAWMGPAGAVLLPRLEARPTEQFLQEWMLAWGLSHMVMLAPTAVTTLAVLLVWSRLSKGRF